ncbi:RNA-binding S4 domain-containing protein [Mesorhizobium sp. CAU 1741]|uniref:RNA-binding S4 domain-containing protein n=1 Tax=Mesorhizobium sp. CAU 1741 TaxID=3140366 RepID=UPI00325BB134
MPGEGRQRVDKWLFFARAIKSRSLAAKLVQAGRVRLNRDKIDQPSHPVKIGDVLTITLERRVIIWRVLASGVRRGPAEEARTLYEDMTPPAEARDDSLPDALVPVRAQGSGRPTKKERRRIDALRDDE